MQDLPPPSELCTRRRAPLPGADERTATAVRCGRLCYDQRDSRPLQLPHCPVEAEGPAARGPRRPQGPLCIQCALSWKDIRESPDERMDRPCYSYMEKNKQTTTQDSLVMKRLFWLQLSHPKQKCLAVFRKQIRLFRDWMFWNHAAKVE